MESRLFKKLGVCVIQKGSKVKESTSIAKFNTVFQYSIKPTGIGKRNKAPPPSWEGVENVRHYDGDKVRMIRKERSFIVNGTTYEAKGGMEKGKTGRVLLCLIE